MIGARGAVRVLAMGKGYILLGFEPQIFSQVMDVDLAVIDDER